MQKLARTLPRRRQSRFHVHLSARQVRLFCYVIGTLMAVSILFQLLYPAGRVLPFVEVGDTASGGASTEQVKAKLTKAYAKARLNIRTQDKTFTKQLDQSGIDIEAGNTARAAARYPLGQRFIPFSSVFIMLSRNEQIQVRIDDERLEYVAHEVEKDGFVAAVNAGISVADGKVVLSPAKPSKVYPAKSIIAAIRAADFKPTTAVQLEPQIRQAERTDKEVSAVLKTAQRAVDQKVELDLKGESILVSKATVGSWLTFPEDAKTKQLTLALNHEAVTGYLEGIQQKIYKAPGTTTVKLIDGREVGRDAGKAGLGIDMARTTTLLKDKIDGKHKGAIEVPLATLEAKVVYDRQYSNTDAGLRALLADIVSSKGGYGISVMEIGGRSGAVNADKKFVAASTYKLYVAYAVFKHIESGKMSWTDIISGGQNAERCFEIMIVKSDNPCAKAFGDRIGWQAIEDMMRGLGLTHTELSPSLYTSASDLALFMYKLEAGTLLSSPDRARLIDAMKRQIYRQAIPAGTGVSVADKVGFIDSYIHDAAIVYGPRGPYVMVLMTSGSSWSQMADAARQIHTYLSK